MYAFDLSNYYECFSTLFALFLLLFTIIFPILVTIFLWRKHEDKEIYEDAFKERFDSLILDLNIRRKSALFSTLAFMFRRWFVALAIVSLPRWNWA